MQFKRIFSYSICFVVLLIGSLFLSKISYAAVRTWDGEGTDGTCGGAAGDGNKWSCAANWSSNTIPTSSDVVTFDSTSTKDATIDASFAGSVSGVDINTGYSGTITQSRSLTIGTGNFDQNAGTFTSGSQTMDLNGSFNLTGGTFNATTGTFTADRGFSVTTGTFNHNSGTVVFDSTTTTIITCGATTFNAVTISKTLTSISLTVSSGCTLPISGTNPTLVGAITNAGTVNVTGNPTFNGSLTLNSGGVLSVTGTTVDINENLTLNGGTFPAGITTLNIGTSLSNTGNVLPNGLTLNIDGTNSGASISCGNATFSAVTILKPTGGYSVTIASNCTLPISGTNPTLRAAITNNGTINVTGNATIDGSYTSNSGAVLSVSGTTVDINETLTLNGGTFPAGITTLNIGTSLSNPGNALPNGLILNIDGNNSGANISCGNATFSAVTILKPNGGFSVTIASNCTLPISGTDPTLRAALTNNGTINVTGNLTIDGTYTSNTGAVLSVSGTTIDINSSLTLNGGTFPAGITTLYVGANLSNTGNILPNGLTLIIDTGNSGITISCGNATFSAVSISKPNGNFTVSISSNCTLPISGTNPTITGSITNSGSISVTGNLILEGSYTSNSGASLSVTGTTVDVNGHLTLTAGTFPSGITTLSVGGNFDNTNNLLADNIALTMDGTNVVSGTMTCGDAIYSAITINKPSTSYTITQSGTCTTGSFTLSSGHYGNPASSTSLYVSGNLTQSSAGTLGGSNVIMELNGSGTQTVSKSAGTFSSVFRINSSGGSVVLGSSFSVTTQTCTVIEGIFDLAGYDFTCGSTFTIQDGGSLQIEGGESPTSPVLNSGSTVIYKGDGDDAEDSYRIKEWNYHNLIVNFTDSEDILSTETNITTGLAAYWAMDEASGNLTDSSGNGNTCTVTGTAVVAGQSGSARSFNGDDVASCGSVMTPTLPISFAFWTNPSSTTPIGMFDSAPNQTNVLRNYSAGIVEWWSSSPAVTLGLSASSWQHIVLTFRYTDGNRYIDYYKNGAFVSTSAGSTSTSVGWTTFTIGNINGGSVGWYNGILDDFRIYNNRALEEDEAETLYSGGTPVSSITVLGDLTISSGTFESPATLTVTGDFNNSGTFTHNSGTVVLNGTNQELSGSTTFNNFTKNITSPADTLTFPASATQTFVGTMDLQGTSGNLLSLVSSSPPSQWNIDPQGTRTIAYLDVSDSNNINATQIATSGFNITDGGGNNGWDFGASPEPAATTPTSITQSSNADGYITFTTTMSDGDNSDTRFKVEYSDDGGTSWYDPILVSATPASGTTDLDNAQTYQVGSVNPIDTSGGPIDVTVVWNTKSASNGNGSLDDTNQSDIQLRVIPNDNSQDGDTKTSTSFSVDNLDPTAPGSFTTSTMGGTSAPLTWTATTETNFDHYEIWYGTTQSDVENRTGTASEWDNSDDSNLLTGSTTTTTVTLLSNSTTYYFKIWAVDDYGNETPSSNTTSGTTSNEVTWDGGASTSAWTDANNWDGNFVPTSTSDVIINSNVTVNIAASTTINSLTLGNSGGSTTPTLNFSYDAITDGALIIDAGDLTVYSGATVTHTVGTSVVVGTVYIDVQTGDATVTGSISTTSKGYAVNEGPGETAGVSGGAGHGGVGGTSSLEQAGGPAYGSIKTPTTLGTGGGSNGINVGGVGGGAIRLNVTGTTNITGSIVSNGGDASGCGFGWGAGSASGGSIYITTGTLSGNGSVTANGGAIASCSSMGGAGSGGRIALYYTTDSSSLTTTAYGGAEGIFGTGSGGVGGAGTIFKKSAAQTNGDLYVDNTDRGNPVYDMLTHGNTPINETISFDAITVSNYGHLYVDSSANITYSTLTWSNQGLLTDNNGVFDLFSGGGDLTIPATSYLFLNAARTFDNVTVNGTLSHTDNATTETYDLDLTVNNDLTISSGGSINANYRGFTLSAGTGQGADGTGSNGGGGGGYGGAGGDGSSNASSGGTTYGSLTQPVNIGSGGGTGAGSCGPGYNGDGGGNIKLTVSGTTTVTGSISANGQDGCNSSGVETGGGSGGSIYITTQTLAGAGTVSVDGGTGNLSGGSLGGGGGGGRIAYYVAEDTSTITYTATGGQGANDGADGTIYPRQAPSATDPTSMSQANDGTGYLTFSTIISDNDNEDSKLKVEYSDDAGTTWYDADLVSVTPSTGSVDLDDAQTYQIGTVNPIDSSGGAITLTIVWDTQSASNGGGSLDGTRQTDIRLRVIPNDTFLDGVAKSSGNFEVDNAGPSTPSITLNATPTTIVVTWTAVTEPNFNGYEIWYGTTQSDVENRTGTATLWDSTDDANLSTRTTTSTTISGVTIGETYYLRMWAVDNFSNETNSATNSVTIPSGNATPDVPSSLAPTNLTNGNWTNDTTPTFTFTLSDSDVSDTLRYRIQIDNNADFSSPIVNYLSSLATPGSRTFTVGQSAGSGTYTNGSSGQTLSDGNYYLRVKAIDFASAESSYVSANSGSVAFKVDTVDPKDLELTAPANNSYTNNQRPTFGWNAATDEDSGIDNYEFEVENGTLGGYNISDIPSSGTQDYSTNTYTASFSGFSDSSSTNDAISIVSKASSSWGSSNNNGSLNEGKIVWTISAIDNAGNSIDEDRTLFVDLTGPFIDELNFNGTNVLESRSYDTSDRTPTISGKIIDPLSSTANLTKVASGVEEIEIKIEQLNSFGILETHTIYTFEIDENFFSHDNSVVTDYSINTSDKYALFSYTPSQDLPNGEYVITITVTDRVGNTGTIRTQTAEISSPTVTPTPTPAITPVPTGTVPSQPPADSSDNPSNNNSGTPITTTITNVITSATNSAAQKASNAINGAVQIAVNIYWNTVETVSGVVAGIGTVVNTGIQNTPEVVIDLTDIALSPIQPVIDELILRLTITAETWFDQEPTRIFNLSVIELGTDYAVIYWETNHHATSKVNYGPDYDYGFDIQSDDRVLEHIVRINGLNPGTTYFYEVMSQNRNYVYDARHEFTTNAEGITRERIIPEIIEQERTALRNLLLPITENPILGPIAKAIEQSAIKHGIALPFGLWFLVSLFLALLNYLWLFSKIPLTQLIPLLLFMFRKKRHPWGIVYDSKTKEPLDPVIVELTDTMGNKVQRITDMYGRYEFIVEPGIYKINVIKTNYNFPSKILEGKNSDELYENLYFGKEFKVGKDEKVAFNIPMDQGENIDWNQEEKRKRNLDKNHKTLRKFSASLFKLCLIYSVIVYFINPTFTNLFAVGLFFLVSIFNLFNLKNRSWGTIVDSNMKPFKGVAVRLINSEIPLLKISPVVTKESGRYNFLVEKGIFQIAVHVKQPDGTYKEIYRTSTIKVNKKFGEVHKDIKLNFIPTDPTI